MVGWECRNVFKGSRVVSRPLPWKWLINGCLGDPHHTEKTKSSRMIFPSGFSNHGVPPLVFFRAASQFWGSKTSQSRWSKTEPNYWVFSPPMNEKFAPQSSIWSESPHKSGWKVFKKNGNHHLGTVLVYIQFICFIIVVTFFCACSKSVCCTTTLSTKSFQPRKINDLNLKSPTVIEKENYRFTKPASKDDISHQTGKPEDHRLKSADCEGIF